MYEAVQRLPCRSKVRLRAEQPLAMLSSESVDDVLVVERTFLDVPSRLREPNSVIQSTTEVHRGGVNPRRRAAD